MELRVWYRKDVIRSIILQSYLGRAHPMCSWEGTLTITSLTRSLSHTSGQTALRLIASYVLLTHHQSRTGGGTKNSPDESATGGVMRSNSSEHAHSSSSGCSGHNHNHQHDPQDQVQVHAAKHNGLDRCVSSNGDAGATSWRPNPRDDQRKAYAR